jgi:hypothetical protein
LRLAKLKYSRLVQRSQNQHIAENIETIQGATKKESTQPLSTNHDA